MELFPNEIFNDDCNTRDPIPGSNILYKHVNYCGVDRPCEKAKIEEEEKYCKHLKHEKTNILCRDLYKFVEELHALYPFICELCKQDGHFNFQCLHFNDSIVSQFCYNMMTQDLYEELKLFLMCEDLSQKISWLGMSTLGTNVTLTKCSFHYDVLFHENIS